MSGAMETQRLISVSLGKIAQSRCQKGGINLHKNLLVATVLHKARTAYIMESYNYQQHLHRQKLQQQDMLYSSPPSTQLAVEESTIKDESMLLSSESANVCQSNATFIPPENQTISSTTGYENKNSDLMQSQGMEAEITQDKENYPPCIQDRLAFPEAVSGPVIKEQEITSNQLSKEGQLSSSSSNVNNTKCKVLKRRRQQQYHEVSSLELDCPARKKARLGTDLTQSSILSLEDSDSQLDIATDSPQISNLVNIFNSGFSGLCAVTSEPVHNSSGICAVTSEPVHNSSGICAVTSEPVHNSLTYQSDISNNQSNFSNKSKTESTAMSSFSRMLPDSSLLCSSQVSRLESLPSAIVLSA